MLTTEQREAILTRLRQARERNKGRDFRLPSGTSITGSLREYFFAVYAAVKDDGESS